MEADAIEFSPLPGSGSGGFGVAGQAKGTILSRHGCDEGNGRNQPGGCDAGTGARAEPRARNGTDPRGAGRFPGRL